MMTNKMNPGFRFDLNVYRFVKIKYSAGYFVPIHSHKFFHYFFIIKGSGSLEIGGSQFNASEGEFYMVPIDVEHSISADKNGGFQTIEIKFIPTNDDIIRILNELPYKINKVDENIPFILNDLVKEATRKDILYESIINNKFTEIMLLTLRKYASWNQDSNNEKSDIVNRIIPESKIAFNKAIKYINDNIDMQFDISEVARVAGFSGAHFCTLFRETFNISPRQYINSLKHKKAKELLLYSDLNISQIADALGFQSIHYFSRFFKKWEGLSPQEYMHKTKDNLFLELIENVADTHKVQSI